MIIHKTGRPADRDGFCEDPFPVAGLFFVTGFDWLVEGLLMAAPGVFL